MWTFHKISIKKINGHLMWIRLITKISNCWVYAISTWGSKLGCWQDYGVFLLPGLVVGSSSPQAPNLPCATLALNQSCAKVFPFKWSCYSTGQFSLFILTQKDLALILLPLHLALLMHKNPQTRKVIHGMHPIGCKDWLIDLNMCICSCNFCGSYYGCCDESFL